MRRADAGIGSDAMPGHRTRQARRRSRCAFAIDGDWGRWSEAAAPAFLLAVRQPWHMIAILLLLPKTRWLRPAAVAPSAAHLGRPSPRRGPQGHPGPPPG